MGLSNGYSSQEADALGTGPRVFSGSPYTHTHIYYIYIHIYIYVYICKYVSMYIYLSIYLSIHLSIYPSSSLSLSLSIAHTLTGRSDGEAGCTGASLILFWCYPF